MLGALALLLRKKGVKAAYFPLILIGIGLVELAIFYIVAPNLLQSMVEYANIVRPSGGRATILDCR